METEGMDDGEDDAVDYQLGQAQTSGEGVDLGEESEFLPWDLEVQTAFKRLAIDIYPSEEAGIRETLTNATSAIIDSVEQGDLQSITDGHILFEIRERSAVDDHEYSDASELELTIRDNGTGMTEATVREVLRVLGRSLTRDSGNRSGKFGMGFVAVFLLLGLDNVFELHTHSREDGEEPISAAINNEGITIDHEGVLPGGFGEDEYGTKLKFILKDELDRDTIRKWVRKNADHARVPVTYREVGVDDGIEHEREFGLKELGDDFNPFEPVIEYEDEFVRAVMAPEADGQTLLLDAPIRRGYNRNGPLPWSFDIRLKNENSPIVKSDDLGRIGLFVTDEGDYKNMAPERREQYTPELRNDEVAMASVTGTRDTLKTSSHFWKEYVFPNLYEEYKSRVCRVLDRLDDPSDLTDLSRTDIVLAKQAVSDRIDEFVGGRLVDNTKDDYTATNLIGDIDAEFGVELDENVARLLVALKRDVWVLSPDYDVSDQPEDYVVANEFGEREAWEVADGDAGRVFMGVAINQQKADVVWEDSEDNRVVRLDSADDYDVFERALGWERLADVTRSTIDEFDISDELRDEFTEEVGTKEETSADEQEVTLTYRTLTGRYSDEWKLQREGVTASTLQTDFWLYDVEDDKPAYGDYGSRCHPRLLVLFPDESDENISDYYWLASKDLCLARVSDDVAEYLSDGLASVMTIDEYLSEAESYRLMTNDGHWNLSSIRNGTVFHLLPDDEARQFRQPEVLANATDALKRSYEQHTHKWPRNIKQGEVFYSPITREEFLYARYHLKPESDAMLITSQDKFQPANDRVCRLGSDTQLYAQSMLSGLDEVPKDVVDFFGDVDGGLDAGGKTVVDALVDHYDSRY